MSEQDDQTDTNIFNIFGKKTKKNDSQKYEKTQVDKYSEIYNMDHYKRGKVIVFNHKEFDSDGLDKRSGTEVDVASLTEVFKSLLFDIDICDDYTYSEIYDKLNEVAEADHSDSDCLVVVVLSHGASGKLYAKDYGYPPDTLWTPFAGDKCPTLAGKPKIFLIQAPRGNKLDSGITSRFMSRDASATSSVYTIPAMADMLVMYSTYEGYTSWTNPVTGSYFIQALCEELKQSYRESDLMAILTNVNFRMATEFESYAKDDMEIDGKKQIGSIVSTFTRLLYFHPPAEYK